MTLNTRIQYLNNILKGVVGLTVVKHILNIFKDVDARWLVTGEGSPIEPMTDIRRECMIDLSRKMGFSGWKTLNRKSQPCNGAYLSD